MGAYLVLREASRGGVRLRTHLADKELKALIRAAEKQGWRVERTKKGHWQFYAPDGENIVTAAGTSGGGRGTSNLLSRLRRYGFKG